MAALIQANGNTTPIDTSKIKLSAGVIAPLVSDPFALVQLTETSYLFVHHQNLTNEYSNLELNMEATGILHDAWACKQKILPVVYGDAVYAFFDELNNNNVTTLTPSH